MTQREAYERLKNVRDDLDAASFAISQTLRLVRDDLKRLQEASKNGINAAQLTRCLQTLEMTYILRLFSEFEAAVRDYWIRTVRNSRPQMELVMNRVADRLGMTDAHRIAAHEIRDYRNDVIHQSERVSRFTFADCVKALGNYLSWFPVLS